MSTSAALLALANARHGHFVLESGLHSTLWLELEPFFLDAARIAPYVRMLMEQLSQDAPELICGPLSGGAFLAQLLARELGVQFCYTERAPADPATPGGALFSARYTLPRAFEEAVRGQRVTLVDDAMSAGSSLRATLQTLREHNALVVSVGALLVLGERGQAFFDTQGIPVRSVAQQAFEAWPPETCPVCTRHQPVS
jgi:orotate phosphoribosyltransferase